jgi:hypothetical protein
MSWLVTDGAADETGFVGNMFALHILPLPLRVVRCSAINRYVELAKRMKVASVWTDASTHILENRMSAATMFRSNVSEEAPPASMYVAFPDEKLMTKIARDFTIWLKDSVRKTSYLPSPIGLWHLNLPDEINILRQKPG